VADNLANIWERNYYSRSLRPETLPVLEALKQQGLVMGIISNTPSYTQVYEILHEYGIRGYFDCIYLSAVSGYRKPNAELFLAAACDLGALPGQCIYVGDTVSRDVRGSRLAGYLDSIRINSELTNGSDAGLGTEGEEAGYLVSSLMEIPGIVQSLRAR
jgi:putative hydrolase of the HAD superfamily